MILYDQTYEFLIIIFPNLNSTQRKALKTKLPLCILKFQESGIYFGTTPEWLFIELAAWGCFVVTLVILMVKARIFPIGINQSI